MANRHPSHYVLHVHPATTLENESEPGTWCLCFAFVYTVSELAISLTKITEQVTKNQRSSVEMCVVVVGGGGGVSF